MGATESITIPAVEAGALSPEQQAAESQEQPTEQSSDKPAWLPEKFNSPEEMAKAYSELESKMGSTENKSPEEQKDLSIPELSEKDMNYYSQRFADNGSLDEADYKGLSDLGVDKNMVDTYIQGQVAMQQQYASNVYNEVGGEESYRAMTEWASNTLSPEEVTVFDTAVNSGDMTQTMSAVKGLQARYQMENGTQPNLLQGKTTGSGTEAYASLDEMKREMQNPKYRTDPAFRQRVKNKLAVSDIM